MIGPRELLRAISLLGRRERQPALSPVEPRERQRARVETIRQATFDNVSPETTANNYVYGKCVSHTFFLADGTKKSAGAIFPGTLTFGTAAPELMGIEAGAR